MRARNDLKHGCPVEFYSSLSEAWLSATVTSAYDEEITFEYYSPTDPDMPRTGKFSRFSEAIRPVKDKKTVKLVGFFENFFCFFGTFDSCFG